MWTISDTTVVLRSLQACSTLQSREQERRPSRFIVRRPSVLSHMANDGGGGPYQAFVPPAGSRVSSFRRIGSTTAPLLLAIAGSSLPPLPCAFSLSGVVMGIIIMCSIAAANDYTSVLMVRAASNLGVSGYEEVILAAGGRRALALSRAGLIVLLFGAGCGCLTAIEETASRALAELAKATGSSAVYWISADPTGRATFLLSLTAVILLPLSLASFGELPCVSSLGVLLMLLIALYVMCSAISNSVSDDDHTAGVSVAQGDGMADWSRIALQMPRAASTFGYAFYVQPYAVPLLRTLPQGIEGANTVVASLHITFTITSLAYLAVGVGGLYLFGQGHVPQDMLQGFSGVLGGVLAAIFCVYLMLCFYPSVIPLRETLVRLYHESSMDYFRGVSTPPRPAGRAQPLLPTPIAVDTVSVAVNSGDGRADDGRSADALPPHRMSRVAPPPPRPAVLPPGQNALLTAMIIGAALGVALLLPGASATIFALTGATGVCFIGYVFPVYAYWMLPPEVGGAPAQDGTLRTWLVARVLPALVLSLGVLVSILTLAAVGMDMLYSPSAATCG